MTDIMDKFWSAPPVSRTIVAAMFTESALVYSGVLSVYRVLFYPSSFLRLPPQFWRLLTPFLLTGARINFVIDLYLMWTYSSGLELNSPRFTEPGSFFVFVSFVATVIMALGGFLLGAVVFTQSLMLAFVYIFAQDNRGTKAHFIILQIPVELLPWAMLALTFIKDGPYAALQQVTGVLAAHLYDFLTRLYPTFQGGRNIIYTPTAIRRFFGGGVQSRATSYGQAIRPGQTDREPQGRSWTSGFSNSWGGRGAGRRLGGG